MDDILEKGGMGNGETPEQWVQCRKDEKESMDNSERRRNGNSGSSRESGKGRDSGNSRNSGNSGKRGSRGSNSNTGNSRNSRSSKNNRNRRRRKKSELLAALCLALGVLAALIGQLGQEQQSVVNTAEVQESKQAGAAGDVMEVHFIDVGQGDATLISCAGRYMLIDAGEADKGTAIQNYLQKQGVERLDYLILTHPDADHIGGAPVIVTKFEIGQVFVSNFEKDNNTYRKLIQALDYKSLVASVPQVGATFSLGSAVCTVLAPNGEYDNPNDSSIALLIQNGENRFLFTGDAEEKAEQDILAAGISIQADVYKAGHHGSKTSSSEALLDTVNPQWAVISCGADNSYGHPSAQTLDNLHGRGIKVYRTDEQGSIIATSDGTWITWSASPSETWQPGEPTGASPSP